MNSLRVIHPYQHAGMWVFDDETVGLVKEPFISGADVIISKMVHDLPGAVQGFHLIFSDNPFPGYQIELVRRESEFGGVWYFCRMLALQGWLCPALFKYFPTAPDALYVQFQAR